MSQKAVTSLKNARAAASRQKRRSVELAVTEALAAADPITFSEIARRAGVSRQFLYSHPDLRSAVEGASKAPLARKTRATERDHLSDGMRSDNRVLMTKIERQRETLAAQASRIEDLERQQQRWLGDQLEARTAVSPEDHAELRVACDRLMSENSTLGQQVSELRRLVSILEADLAASREAHQADLIEHGVLDAENVAPLRATPPST